MQRMLLVLLVFSLGIAKAPKSYFVLVGFPSLLEESDTQFDLLGGSSGSGWVSDANAFPVKGGPYTLWNLNGKISTMGTGSP